MREGVRLALEEKEKVVEDAALQRGAEYALAPKAGWMQQQQLLLLEGEEVEEEKA